MFGRIIVGTDGSDTAAEAVRQASELAKLSGARLDVVSAFEPIPQSADQVGGGLCPGDVAVRDQPARGRQPGPRQRRHRGKKEGVEEVQTHAREGDPADAILDVAEEINADLIVVGNKGMTGARRFLLGSVPNKVSHHAPCSVIIVRHQLSFGLAAYHARSPLAASISAGAENSSVLSPACRGRGRVTCEPGQDLSRSRVERRRRRRRSPAPRRRRHVRPPSRFPRSRPGSRTASAPDAEGELIDRPALAGNARSPALVALPPAPPGRRGAHLRVGAQAGVLGGPADGDRVDVGGRHRHAAPRLVVSGRRDEHDTAVGCEAHRLGDGGHGLPQPKLKLMLITCAPCLAAKRIPFAILSALPAPRRSERAPASAWH